MDSKIKIIEDKLFMLYQESGIAFFNDELLGKKFISDLISEFQKNINHNGRGIFIAPHIFTLSVPQSSMLIFKNKKSLLEYIGNHLMALVEAAGFSFEGKVTINLYPSEDLLQGEFKVRAIKDISSQSLNRNTESDSSTPIFPLAKAPMAFLIIDGGKIFTLEFSTITVGRNLDNHLVFDDPKISRRHAELKIIKGRYILFDVGTSGGTFVNGDRITQIVLQPGDVISMAGVIMVYGHDSADAIKESQEYEKPKKIYNNTTSTLSSEMVPSGDSN
jgi:hypothetical protein